MIRVLPTTKDYRVEPRAWVPETVPCVCLPDSPVAGKVMAKGNSGLISEEGHEGGRVREVQKTPLYRKMSIVTHVVIFLYAAAFWIQIGAMPFLSKKLGASPVVFGYMETVFAVCMLIGGPIFGRFGDLFGARAALVVAFLSSFLSYTVLAMADSIFMLFLSKICGFMMHAMHGAQMVMTDVSGFTDRADALGRLGVSYGVGMVVGPTVGGYVTTHFSEQHAAAVAAALCVVAIVIVMMVVPSTTKDPVKMAAADSKENKVYESGSIFNLKAILALLAIPAVLYVVVLKAVVGVPAGIFHSMFTIINMERFQLTPETNGRLLSYVGILTMIMQGFGVGFLSKRFPDNLLLKSSIVLMSLSYLVLSFVNSLPFLAINLIPMVLAGSLLNTIANSAITKNVPEAATGTALGLSMATHSLIRTVAPTLGGYMYTWLGYASFGLLGFVLNGALAIATMLPESVATAVLSRIPFLKACRTSTQD